ncbi:MAG: hypothetical protein KC560_12685 [Myxococcales bacterium]|nr:hypothetical protein [Myxococcales bacterium]
MRRWAIRAANAALFTLGCFLAARIAVAILAEVLLPERAEATVGRALPVAGDVSRADTQVILARNLFGAQIAGEAVPTPDTATLEAVETKLPLELLGTVAGEDASVSSAAIQDLGTRKHQVVYVGDAIAAHPSYTVDRIDRGVVYLRGPDKLEKLLLKEDEPDGAKVAAAPQRRGRRVAARTRAQAAAPSDSMAERLAELQEEVGARTTAALYSQARIIPKWEEGKMVGVQLNQVKPGSLYDKIGIRSGDVITSLNGIAIDSPQASSRLLSEFTQAEEFDIVKQDGSTLHVGTSELEGMLSGDDEG